MPFVDVINTMLDESLPLTVGEFEEWGNPQDHASSTTYMKTYCPYDNLDGAGLPGDAGEDVAQRQPGDVLGAGQVRGAGCATLKTDTNPLLLKINMAGRPRRRLGPLRPAEGSRLRLRFVLWQLGVDCGC